MSGPCRTAEMSVLLQEQGAAGGQRWEQVGFIFVILHIDLARDIQSITDIGKEKGK